jgi:hypothetical protein
MKVVRLVAPTITGPPPRGRPSDVKRWPSTYSMRVNIDEIKAFKQAAWAKGEEPAALLRAFMKAFVAQYAPKREAE